MTHFLNIRVMVPAFLFREWPELADGDGGFNTACKYRAKSNGTTTTTPTTSDNGVKVTTEWRCKYPRDLLFELMSNWVKCK